MACLILASVALSLGRGLSTRRGANHIFFTSLHLSSLFPPPPSPSACFRLVITTLRATLCGRPCRRVAFFCTREYKRWTAFLLAGVLDFLSFFLLVCRSVGRSVFLVALIACFVYRGFCSLFIRFVLFFALIVPDLHVFISRRGALLA